MRLRSSWLAISITWSFVTMYPSGERDKSAAKSLNGAIAFEATAKELAVELVEERVCADCLDADDVNADDGGCGCRDGAGNGIPPAVGDRVGLRRYDRLRRLCVEVLRSLSPATSGCECDREKQGHEEPGHGSDAV